MKSINISSLPDDGDGSVVAASRIQTVTVEAAFQTRSINNICRIRLVYANDRSCVLGTEPKGFDLPSNVIVGDDYLNGVPFNNNIAVFRIRINALSSQYGNREFKIEAYMNGKQSVYSNSFKVLSKINRKRKNEPESGPGYGTQTHEENDFAEYDLDNLILTLEELSDFTAVDSSVSVDGKLLEALLSVQQSILASNNAILAELREQRQQRIAHNAQYD